MIIANNINGNAHIKIFSDGTRTISYDGNLDLDYPLNIDIRVSTKCSFGMSPSGRSICSFCHESAITNGKDCEWNILKEKILELPKGTELAIGANSINDNLFEFLKFSTINGYICNITINHGHVLGNKRLLTSLIKEEYVRGIGISYRKSLKYEIPKFISDYENSVVHVISGIDSIDDVISLSEKGIKKILVLGEKDFGFNLGKVDLKSKNHREWFWYISKLFKIFEIVSFDNLALEQLRVERFFPPNQWDIINQGEHSFYINAVDGYYAPSSRSNKKTDWNSISIKDYFKIKK